MPPQYFSFPEKEDKLEDGNPTTDHTDVAVRRTSGIIYWKWFCIFSHQKQEGNCEGKAIYS